MHAGLNRNAKRRCLRYSVVVRSQDSASLAEEGQRDPVGLQEHCPKKRQAAEIEVGMQVRSAQERMR